MIKTRIIIGCFLLFAFKLFSQGNAEIKEELKASFKAAYTNFPTVPNGVLEAVAYTKTRFRHIQPEEEIKSCVGLPAVIGIMGMMDNTNVYFKNTLQLNSSLSGIPAEFIRESVEMNIMAYAASFSETQKLLGIGSKEMESNFVVLQYLSELPASTNAQQYALDAELYSVLTFMTNTKRMEKVGHSSHSINLEKIFGAENLQVLSSKWVTIDKEKVTSINNASYKGSSCLDYPNAIWVAADPSNYSSRNGTAISAVTIHTVQGSYAGCISYFQSSSANVSAHYVVRSSDGQITQMVCEEDKGWHVGTENPYTIGIEHEGFVSDPSWYTDSMYMGSASLVKDIVNSGYGINPLRTAFWPWTATTLYNQAGIPGSCAKIKGHMNFPNQTHTDPGEFWNWELFYKMINDSTTSTLLTDSSGTLYDTGGSNGDYSDDERIITVIEPENADRVTLEFISFDIELDWDYLYIYDGPTVWDSLIGYYTGTNNPGVITSSGSSLTIEFRSDCATTDPGWEAIWTSCPSTQSGFSFADSGLAFSFLDSSQTTGNATYLWDFGNGYLSNIQNPVFNYFDGGTYTVCLTVTDSCGTDSSCQNISVVPLSISPSLNNSPDFIAYPNPFKEMVFIQSKTMQHDIIELTLSDINGRKLRLDPASYLKQSGTNIYQIDLDRWHQGLYFLEIKTTLGVDRIKLLKL